MLCKRKGVKIVEAKICPDHVHKRPNQYVIKGSEVNYEEYYATCDECTEEIFVSGLEDANVERIDQAYREKIT